MVGIIQLSHKMREAQAGNYAYCDFFSRFFFWGGGGIYFFCSNPRSLYKEISIVLWTQLVCMHVLVGWEGDSISFVQMLEAHYIKK